MKKKYQSKILQVIHEDMKGLHELGFISDERMREYDKDCLVQEPVKPRKAAVPAGKERTRKGTAGKAAGTVSISAKGGR